MSAPFFLVGPTATGKSEVAAEVARRIGAEIISADAFQIYSGLNLLTGKPDAATLAKVPHHLIGPVPLNEEMNVEKFRTLALNAIADIHARGRNVIVTGGSGLYIKALTHGLARLPPANPELRAELATSTVDELFARLSELDPVGAKKIDPKNKRRLQRAVEVSLLTGVPFSSQRNEWTSTDSGGLFVFRNRAELYERINRRVEEMFAQGVVNEVRDLGECSATAAKAIGLLEIRDLIAGKICERECIERIQQATRRYAKRQLTWFQRQPNFQALNLSLHGFAEAIELIAQDAARVCANG